MWLGAGNAGTFGGGFLSVALLGSALMLAPILLIFGRKRPDGGLLPPSPAFDPGSTPG
jgi:hypothetical protein